MAEIHIDENALRRAVQPQVDALEKQLNQVLQDTIREVRDEHVDGSVDDVYQTLVSRLTQAIQGFQPNQDQLRKVAQEIVDGTLTD